MSKTELNKIKLTFMASRFAVSRLISEGSSGFLTDKRNYIQYTEVLEILNELEKEYDKK